MPAVRSSTIQPSKRAGKRSLNIHERFLRHIWSNLYLHRSKLRTADNRPVLVLNVGLLNLDGGPDFLNAKIKIGPVTYCGDVEIHRNAFEWLQHRHQDDPRYNKVVLHVVLEADRMQEPIVVESGRSIPLLVLEPFLSQSIRFLWQKTILDERARTSEKIPCHGVNDVVTAELLAGWLRRLSVERLELKLRRFEERIKELAHVRMIAAREPAWFYAALPTQGNLEDIPPPVTEPTPKDLSERLIWEQTLYEGLMEALGFSKNRDPFIRLARSVTLAAAKNLKIENDPISLQALLYGAAGLLPKIGSLREKESKEFARLLIRRWKELRPVFRGPVFHAGDWQFFPTRPTNFPTLRLAAASALLQKFLSEDFFRRVIQSIKSSNDMTILRETLRIMLAVQPPVFWSHHYNFHEASRMPIKPLGSERISDMIVNAVVPVALLYARTFKDKTAREQTLRLYETFPPLTENSLTRLMEKQLLKGRLKLQGVGLQQGVIQLYKFYCVEERCSECDVGKNVFQ